MSERFTLPKNLTLTWHRGSRSFTEVNYHNERLHLDYEKFAEYGKQLPELDFRYSFWRALIRALSNPKEKVQWVRYDHEEIVAENGNNAPYRLNDGKFVKRFEFLDKEINV